MKLAISRLFIVSGSIAVIVATAFLLLIFRQPTNRPPERRRGPHWVWQQVARSRAKCVARFGRPTLICGPFVE